MVTSKSNQDKNIVLTERFYTAVSYASKQLAIASKKHDSRFDLKTSIVGPAFLNGQPISSAEAAAFLITAKTPACEDIHRVNALNKVPCSVAKAYEFEYKQSVNEDSNAMLTTILVPFFPFAQEASDWIDVAYEAIEEAQEKYPEYVFYLCGVEVGFNALMHRVYSLFPRLFIGTFFLIFLFLGFLLKSLFVPIRLMLTLVAPLLAVFGSAVLVYQKGWLEWTGLAAFEKMDGFFWYIPILLLSMIVGLGLDWDILLISRIMEHRERGYDVRASICKACCETGGTISSAGIIMCLAFGGMLLSDQATMNACGFILTTALILDTFVVNTVLVPALISIGDKVAWYPKR